MGKKLEQSLASLPSINQPALMTHVVLGYPDLPSSMDLVKVMADSGVSFIELQIPFSDPIADGPSIMGASEQALAGGIKTSDCLKAMESLSKVVNVPLLFMSYYNIVFNCPNFAASAASAGCEGLIVPDISPAESNDDFFEQCAEAFLPVIPLVSPVTSKERLGKISNSFPDCPFVYCVSTTGTTGVRDSLPEGLTEYLQQVSLYFKTPRAVGFGISKASHIQQLKGSAEIAIIGSAIINLISSSDQPLVAVKNFIEGLS